MRGERPRRVRWGRAAIALGLLALAIAWPRLAPPAPRLPSDVGIPVATPRAAGATRSGRRAEQTRQAERRRAERTRQAERRRAERTRQAERRQAERRRRAERTRRAERQRRRAVRGQSERGVGRRGGRQDGERTGGVERQTGPPARPRAAPRPASPPTFRPADPAETEFSFERG